MKEQVVQTRLLQFDTYELVILECEDWEAVKVNVLPPGGGVKYLDEIRRHLED